MSPMIQVRGVERYYGEGDALVRALDGVNLDVERGVFMTLMGPSGSGKSTMLNVLGCLDVPTAGSYLLEGREMVGLDRRDRALVRREKLGFVFQGFNLLERSSAVENVELPLVYQGVGAKERRQRAMEALEQVGLASRAAHLPSEISGGQQQRVAIARAIVTQPEILLADEPTGNLDTKMSHGVMQLLQQLNKSQGITIIMVSHEQEMMVYTDQIVRFRDGRIEGISEVEHTEEPS